MTCLKANGFLARLAGADVGGLFVSANDAKTWSVCNVGLATKWVYGIEFLDDNTPLLATTEGVYRGRPSSASGSCLWDFILSNEGLNVSNMTENMASSGFKFRHPVRVLHVVSPTKVWAGIGIAKNRATCNDGAARLGDPFHVYVSDDGGQRWRGVLTLPQGAGQVLSISSSAAKSLRTPGSESIFVSAGSAGAYMTDDGGSSWVELGVSPVMVTHDAGRTWKPCALHTCPARFRSRPCNPHATANGTSCLPVNAKQNETHPNVATVAVTSGKVFLTLFDTSEADVGLLGQCEGGASRPDPNLKQYRGGPWMSTNGGVSFVHLFRQYPFRGATLRCPGTACEYSTPNFPNVAVDPADDSHIFLGAPTHWHS
eukprot:SAG31_NODE_62_length_28678_cov_21.548270_17_plen_371_part_00